MTRPNLIPAAVLGAALAVEPALAGSPRIHDLFGGEAFTTEVTGYLTTDGNDTAYLRILGMQDEFRTSLNEAVRSGNTLVRKSTRDEFALQLGCIKGMTVTNEMFEIPQAPELLYSSPANPVTVVLEFKEHPGGWGGECISLADGLTVK